MTSRDQLTEERVDTLLEAIEEASILPAGEASGLRSTTKLREARGVRARGSPPPVVTRAKVSESTHTNFMSARDAGDLQTQIDVLYHVLTGDDPTTTVTES